MAHGLVGSDDVNPAFAWPINLQIAFLPMGGWMDDGDAHNFLNPDCDRLMIIQEFGGTPSNDLLIFDVILIQIPTLFGRLKRKTKYISCVEMFVRYNNSQIR